MSDSQVAQMLFDLALITVVALLVGRLARFLGQPPVLGEIVAGILMGPTLLNGAVARDLFPTGVRPSLGALSDVGLVVFMFVVGLEFDHERVRGCGRVATSIAAGALLLPFGLGCLLALDLVAREHPAHRLAFVLFLGVALSITAFPVLARILADRGMTASLLGAIALSAAAICDLAAWTMLAVVQAIAGGTGKHWLVVLVLPYGIVLRYGLRRLSGRLAALAQHSGALLALILAGLLGSAALTQALGLHFVFGAFLFGLALPREGTEELRARLLERTTGATTLLMPVYFVVAGFNVDLTRINGAAIGELALILATAIVGKFLGAFVGARSQGLRNRQSAVLATLMNTRGLTELIVLSVGLQAGLISQKLYTLLVVTAVVTTAMTGPLLRWLAGPADVAEHARILDQSPALR
jgi:Kef-type K+ transport system membrane component KefB